MFERIKKEWREIFSKSLESNSYQKVLKGTITKIEYAEILKQFYFYTATNPQVQALVAVYFKGQQRGQVKGFFRHAISEIGHDQMALNDIQAMGLDIDFVGKEYPLSQTQALIAHPFYLAQFGNPVAYLGYLFHLEFTPTTIGKDAMEGLLKAGIPIEALSFLHEHATVDEIHNKFMEDYVANLVCTEKDFQDVIVSMRDTAYYHTKMMDDAIEMANTRKKSETPRLIL
jgi:hypothetical protein